METQILENQILKFHLKEVLAGNRRFETAA